MRSVRLAILGAGGFVGATLCERLFFTKEFEFRPLVHGYGNTSRLARFPLKLAPVDVMSCRQLRAALDGCDVVVNLARGNPMQMQRAMKNILRAGRKAGVKKLIHLSSISIYGSNPCPECREETAIPVPDAEDWYGLAKLAQDEEALKMHRRGFPVILLCPANIYGPYSAFIVGAVHQLLAGRVALVDGGRNPTNHVHVENVAEAILAAARSEKGWGERYFVNDPEPTSWKDFYDDLRDMLGLEHPLPSVDRADVLNAISRPQPAPRLRDNFKVLLSSEFRQAMRMVPAFRRFNDPLYRRFVNTSLEFQAKIRGLLDRPTLVPKDCLDAGLHKKYVGEQLKSVFHSPARAMDRIGFRPVYRYSDGMRTVRKWLEFANIIPLDLGDAHLGQGTLSENGVRVQLTH